MVGTFERIYEVEIYGCDYDSELDEWDENTRECISQDQYDSYVTAVSAVRSITQTSAAKLEKQSGCNGLDVVIYERCFADDDEVSWDEIGCAQWVGEQLVYNEL